MIELEKNSLYGGVMYELMKTDAWELYPKRLMSCDIQHEIDFTRVFEYLFDLVKTESEDWFVSSIILIIGMNCVPGFSKLYQEVLIEHRPWSKRLAVFHFTSSIMVSVGGSNYRNNTALESYIRRIGLLDIHEEDGFDLIISMIDLLNSKDWQDEILILKLMHGGK